MFSGGKSEPAAVTRYVGKRSEQPQQRVKSGDFRGRRLGNGKEASGGTVAFQPFIYSFNTYLLSYSGARPCSRHEGYRSQQSSQKKECIFQKGRQEIKSVMCSRVVRAMGEKSRREGWDGGGGYNFG